MNRRLLSVSALTCAAMFGLAGCGQATQATQARSTGGDSPVSSDPDAPGGPSLAQWPATGCQTRSVVSIDYGRMPTGYATPEEAVEQSPAAGLPAGELELAPYAGKGPAQVWVIDPGTEEIRAQVSVFRGPDGWFVDGVTTCG